MAASNDFPSQPGPPASHYKVFLSFRGPDARLDVAEGLYRELIHGATPHVFRDEEEIHLGEEIKSTSIESVERSDISIPIISPRYAESKACLMKLAHMSLLRKTKRHKVIPIFYLTEPKILEGFPQAFSNKVYPSPELDEFFGGSEIIDEWKEALSDLANDPPKYYCLSEEHNRSSSIDHGGSTMQDSDSTWTWSSSIDHGGSTTQDSDSTWTRPRTELLSAVVSDVKAHLRWDDLVVPGELLGIDHHVIEIMTKLGVVCRGDRAVELLRGEEIRVVTITGLRGIGKTTLAKAVYNKIHHLFQACSFLENIHERLQEDRIESLQQRLLSYLNKRKFPKLDYKTNINALNTMFKKTSVLIILDDVCDIKDVEGLAADCNWFGLGSRIILTSNMRLEKTGLIKQAQEHVVEEMDPDLAIQLFLTHAYGQNPPQHLNEYDLSDLAKKIINVVPGIPSAIGAIGRSLHGKDIVTWLEMLDQLKPKHATNITSPSLYAGGPLASHYDVFLSFRGPDTRYFVETLYSELKAAGISCAFGDEEETHGGEDINATLIQAIELSDISIPIISPHYTDSKACLMELAHMSQCRKMKDHKVIPVFYLVEPSILECFPEAFGNKINPSPELDKIISNSEKTIEEWEKALSDFVKEPPKYFCLSKIVTWSQSIYQRSSSRQDLQPTWTQNWREILSAVVSDVQAHRRTGTIFVPAGNPGHSSSSNSYDVFISFCGSDTRLGFTDFLYHGLVDAGVSVYRDIGVLPGRVDARTEIMERSKIVIPIISCNYASSRFLLYELAKIYVFKKRTMNRSIIPIYYYVNPSHTCNCEGHFWDQIHEHEKSGVDPYAIDLWKQALREIANLKGFWISDDCNGEALIMKRIISTVICQLHIVGEVVRRNLVGVEHHVQNILKKLNVVYDRETVGVRVVGIYGRRGVGKTTLARAVYDDLCPLYCSSAFLANTGERSLASLQGQLIWDLQKPEHTRPFNFEEGREILKSKFRQKRVLIVLDNMGDFEQIKALAANLHWFGPGSRIVITSETKNVLDYFERATTETYELGSLEPDKALELFCKHAFGEGLLKEDYQSLCEHICSAVGGLPLAIAIVGSYLNETEIGTWKKTLQITEREPNVEAGVSKESSHVLREIVKKILWDISARDEHLGKNMKEMFFDVACFLFAADERFALRMWSSCNRSTNEGMQLLRRLCFVETAEKNQLEMHELLQGIGREMAEEEDLKERGVRRRLWNHQDAQAVLQGGKGTEEVEALCLTFERNSDGRLTSENFEGLLNLKYLRLSRASIRGDFKNLLPELRWLQWNGCPKTIKAKNMHLEKLVILDLSWSSITEDWQGWTEIQMPWLKVLNLTGCTDLLLTPSFYAYPNLEILILEHCHKLGKLDSSVVILQLLVCLNLKFCRSLHELPDGLGNMEALKELLIDQTPLKEIPGLVGDYELEALLSSSTQHFETILPPEVSSVLEPKKLKIFDHGSICIERKSKKAYLDLTGKLVGIDLHVREILRKLDMVNPDERSVKQYSKGVRAVQICGPPGAGKTTLAKAVYDKISPLYSYCTFLEDISENAKQKGIISLQEQLLADLMKQECPHLQSSDEATRIIKRIFRSRRVLIVLDDVNCLEQINPFVQKLGWFGPGSKIIITTSHQSSFLKDDRTGVIANYEIAKMSYDEALLLFNKHAFRGCPSKEYDDLPGEIISVIGRLPLTIGVVASHLYPKRLEKDAWKKTLMALQKMESPSDLQKAFMISVESLTKDTKNIFLDIACFLVGKDKRFAEYMFEAGPREIETLCDMSLLEIAENSVLGMHCKLRNFGREVATEENSKGSARLWNHKDALSTLRTRKGGQEVVGLALEPSCAAELINDGRITDQPAKPFTCDDFYDLQNLRFLKLGCTNIYGNFESNLPNLRWLDWQGCPDILGATNLHLRSLIILELSWSKLNQDWNGWSQLEMINLKVLNLTGCTNLVSTPDLSSCQCLEILILEGCIQLVELHPSIGELQSLVTLNLKSCSRLNTFLEILDELRALEELLIDGTSIHEIPSSIGHMKQLKIFSASDCTKLSALPDSIGKLVKLEKLSLRNCSWLAKLPDTIKEMKTSLKELDVSGTGISRLSNSITNLQNLRVLRMDSCFITQFPCNIGKLRKLEEIHASKCMSMEGPIPSEIGKLKGLRILRLQYSKISSLPTEIQQLSSLQTLDLLHCNMLQEFPRLPANLIDLHVNPRLWKIIGYSGTPRLITSMNQLPQLPHRRHSYEEEMRTSEQVEEEERSSGQQGHKEIQKEKNKVEEEERSSNQQVHEGIQKEKKMVEEEERSSSQPVHEGIQKEKNEVEEEERSSSQQVQEGIQKEKNEVEEEDRSSSQRVHEGIQKQKNEVEEEVKLSSQQVHEGIEKEKNVVEEEERSSNQHIHEGVQKQKNEVKAQLMGKVTTFDNKSLDKSMMDEGGFGRVLRGHRECMAKFLVVKRLNHNCLPYTREFLAELNRLSVLHHPNLVKFVGWCAEEDQLLLLVHDFVCRGSLKHRLHDRCSPLLEPLDWNTRMKIAVGVAKGLEYLHHMANPPVIHGNLITSNILLDESFHPKLSDFGLGKFCPVDVRTRVIRTYRNGVTTSHLTLEYDVYSFGVILLELITGRKEIDHTRLPREYDLVAWAQPLLEDRRKFRKMADPRLEGRYPRRGLYQALEVADMCLQEGSKRPSIRDVVETLEGESVTEKQ